MPYEGLGMAAGAMSKAIGDIYRGQVEATAQIPHLQDAAQNRAIRSEEMSQKMQKFPLEMAEARQKMQLGSYALEEAPLKIKQLKGTIEGQDLDRQLKDIHVKTAGDEYNTRLKSREAAKAFIAANKSNPGMEWIAAYDSNPDSFLDVWGKMKTEEVKAGFKRPSFDQVLGTLAQKKAIGQPLTPQEQQVYEQGIAWKMKTNNMTITPAQRLSFEKDLYKQANDAFVQSMTTNFGKDMSKAPGDTPTQKQQTINYYKAESMAAIYDSNPAFAAAGIPRPTVPPKPVWVQQAEDKAMQQQQPGLLQKILGGIYNKVMGPQTQTTPTQAPSPAPAQPAGGGWQIIPNQ